MDQNGNYLVKLKEKIYDLMESNFDELVELMNSKEMKDIYEVILKKEINEFTKEEIELVRSIIVSMNYIYNNSGSSTGLSDSDYDYLFSLYKELSKEELAVNEKNKDTNDKVQHRFRTLRGTLDKIYKIIPEEKVKNKSQKSLEDWVNTTKNRYKSITNKEIDLANEKVIVMPKFDGVSCVFECDMEGNLVRALTRGDTIRNEAKDITHIVKDIFKPPFTSKEEIEKSIGEKLPKNYSYYGLKTEIMMLEEDLTMLNQEYDKKYRSTRSMVSSIINSDEKDVRAEYLQIIPLRFSLLKDEEESRQYLAPGVFDYPYLRCQLKDVYKIHDFAFNNKYVFGGLRCDGAVIYLTDPKVQDVLGRENDRMKYEVAYKYTEEKGYSEIVDVEFTTGVFGYLSPVAVFKPIKLKGNEIRKASIGSISRFKSLGLAKGDKVKILYDIVPYIDFDESDPNCKRSKKDKIPLPTKCPICGKKLAGENSMLQCINKKCPSREKGRILNYLDKMNIKNVSYATIEYLYEKGLVRRIYDLYRLEKNKQKVHEIEPFVRHRVVSLLYELKIHKDVTPSLLLGSIGIEGLSVKTFHNILSHITYDELMDFCKEENIEELIKIPGIGKPKALALIEGINENIKLIDKLLKVLNVIPEKSDDEFSYRVCFSKIRDDDLENFIKNTGGLVVDGITKNTDILCVPDLSVSSTKIRKARELNIPIVPIKNLKEYIKTSFI